MKHKKLSISSLKSVKVANYSILLLKKNIWLKLKQLSLWDKCSLPLLICINITFVTEILNLRTFCWKKKTTSKVSNSLILELPKFSKKSNTKINQKEQLCTWHLKSSMGNTERKLIIGHVGLFYTFYSVEDLHFTVKTFKQFY